MSKHNLAMYLKLVLLLLQVFTVRATLSIDEVSDVYNGTVFGDNDLWSGLYADCGKRTSYKCVQQSVSTYLDRTLDRDFVSDAVEFRRNQNNYSDMCRRVKKDNPGEFEERYGREMNMEERSERDMILEEDSTEKFSQFIDSVEEIEGLVRRKSRDLENSVEENTIENEVEPSKNIRDVSDILYDRGLKYLMTHDMELALPSGVFGKGRIRVSPKGFDEDGGALVKINVIPDQPQDQGRFFLKQIQKFFKKKLMTSMLAAMLILKLLKLKMMFFLPLLLGVGTAKKILLKVLLFLFPALTHLFKLCSYYHHKHYTKFHHHHHQIAHHHHHVPVPVFASSHSDSGPGELPAPYPPSVSSYDAYDGPYVHSRTESPLDLAAWGLGEYPASWDTAAADQQTRYPAVQDAGAALNRYPGRPQATASALQQQQYPSAAELKRLYAAATAQAGPLRQTQPQPQPQQQPQRAYDPFYSPMLQRLDAVFSQLNVADEGCRERLVCSMYKNPARYSPHSNLVSAELSRDPQELQKPQSANSATVRFYRYLQAARDGQELKACLQLYPACAVPTE